MANHFTDLGFEVTEPDDLTDLLLQAAKLADTFSLETGGELLRWGVGAGIELWIQVDPFGELVGVHPFFLGPTRTAFRVDRVDIHPEHPQDAALMGWVNPEGGSDAPGAYPMRFDLPAYPQGVELLEDEAVCELQVAAFADDIRLFSTEEEFYASQEADPLFSVQSFVPIGLFEEEDDEPEDEWDEADAEEEEDLSDAALLEDREGQSVAEALFSGYVRRCERRINPFTQKPFWWLQIETFAAEYDAIVDPELLERDPVPNDIVQGQFWMAARITEIVPQ